MNDRHEHRNVLHAVERIADTFQMLALKPRIEACRQILTQGDTVDVGVFGRYKSGKSSLLNALARREVLPVGVLPVTAILTRLRYGVGEIARIRHLDGTEEPVPLNEIAGYVSETNNPANAKRVSIVHIELVSLRPYEGLEFIDTPGTGSIFEHNSQVSLDWVPYVGVALLAISVDHPISEDDISFIEELQKHTPRIVVVLTKADRLSREELAEVVSFSQAHLSERFGSRFPILPFSSLPESACPYAAIWRATLDEQILLPLCRNRGHEQGAVIAHKCRGLLKECAGLLSVALRSAEQSEDERERVKAYVLGEQNSLPFLQKELRLFAHDLTSNMIDRLSRHLLTFQKTLTRRSKDRFQQQWAGWWMNLRDLTSAFEGWLRSELTDILRRLSESERENLLAPLWEAETGLGRIVGGFRERLSLRIRETLNVELADDEHSIRVVTPDSPDISVGRVFDTPWDTLWFIIPVPILRPVIRRHFVRQIHWEIEKNLSRLAAQWSERINRSITEAVAREEKYVDTEIATALSILSQRESHVPSIRQALDETNALSRRLQEETHEP
jgi:hypothetical protein